MKTERLIDLCVGKGEYGIAASAEAYSESKYRYLRITDISDYGELLYNDKKSVSVAGCEKYLLKENDIVFARTGNSTGRSFFYEEKYGPLVYAGFLIKFHLDKNKVNPKYVKYYTISSTYKKWISDGPTGSTRGNMSEGDFANMPVFLPSRHIQDRIVDMIEPIASMICCNQRVYDDYSNIISLLFNYWFVQFDFPNAEGKPYKESGGKMIWSDKLQKEIPENWDVRELQDISSQESTTINPLDDEYYNHYSIPAFDDRRHPSFESGKAIDSNKYSVPSNSILLSKLNPRFKRLWIVGETQDNSICSTEFIPFLPIEVGREFLYSLLNSDEFYAYMINSSSSSTGSRKRMDPELCKIFLFPFPPSNDLVDKFCHITEPLISDMVRILEQNNKLRDMRDFLLSMSISEKITFTDDLAK